MKAFTAVARTVAAVTLLATSVFAQLDPIVIKGSKFFYKTNGTEFFIKGIAYQQDYNGNGSSVSNNQYTDPLASASNCQRDIPLLQGLQTNVIRVYAIDPTQDHSACFSLLQSAGIYVLADLSAPGASINRNAPQWDDDLYSRYTSVIDALANNTNVLGFFAGNEVSNQANNTAASAFVKAAVRDMKSYIQQKNYRTIGVGYAADDDATIREGIEDYFDCGTAAQSIDFFGLNIYEWCGNSSYTASGYDQRTADFQNYTVPAFFAEYGCNTVQPRVFSEVQALYGEQMTPVWSGGIVYEYFQGTNDFGLVSIDGSNSASALPDYTALQSQLASITPSAVSMSAYTPTNTALRSCPTVNAGWAAVSALPPTPNQALCSCMYSALSCVPSSQVTNDTIGEFFGVVCGLGDKSQCNGIAANATTGNYGAYGMCNSHQQLGWALNAYYNAQVKAGNGASACAFSGSATTQSASTPTGSCASLISQAGAAGTGTVTSAPTGTGGSGSGSSSSSKGSAPGSASMPVLTVGFAHLAIYILCAVGTGAGMILL